MIQFLKKHGLFLLMLLAFAQSVFAQNVDYFDNQIEQHSVDEKKWEKSLSEVTYEEKRGEEKEDEKPDPEEEKKQRDFESDFAGIFKVLGIVLAIALVAFLIIKLMNAENLFTPKNRKINSQTTEINIEDIEENLHESDLDKFIRKALAAEDFALAIRLYYLAILKNLSISKQIKWKRDKTNSEYVRELESKPVFKEFREVTRIFDRIWYGKMEIDQTVFEEISPKFKKLAEN